MKQPARTADVYVHDELAGSLERTTHGARFTYDDGYRSRHQGEPQAAVALTLPVRQAPYEVFGVNLHPFFAGLLPEGLRLRALVRAVKTSDDDLFSLLVATGSDAIGAVSVVRPLDKPTERGPTANVRRPESLQFRELLAQSLAYGEGGGDLSIAGIQPKLSASTISFPVRAADKRKAYILKLSPGEYPRLVENEAFFMSMAHAVGIDCASVRRIVDARGESGLLVERFDRVPSANGPGKLGKRTQEDACQLLGRYPADKYLLTLSDVAAGIGAVSSAPMVDVLRLLSWQAFSYAVGNGDMHGKNVSVRRLGQRLSLTPAYDLLSTLPYGDDALALSLEGRDKNLRRAHFLAFGVRHGLPERAVSSMLTKLCKALSPYVERLAEIGFDDRVTRMLTRAMVKRISQLEE